jgi:hypothetical protein
MADGYCPACFASLEGVEVEGEGEDEDSLLVCPYCNEMFPEFLALDANEVKEERASQRADRKREEGGWEYDG